MYLPQILEVLKDPEYIPLSIDRLAEHMEIPTRDFTAFKREVGQHLRQGTLVKLKKNRVCLPRDADLIIDVRFLINPYFVPELKPLDGNNPKIRDFVLDHAETRVFLKKYLDLLDYLIPMYEKEGKAYLTIAVGCTGGRHRSVTIAHTIFDHIRKSTELVEIIHRDIDQP